MVSVSSHMICLDAISEQELVIWSSRMVDLPRQFSQWKPFVESVLPRGLVPEVPLAIVGTVVFIINHFSDGFDRWIQHDVIFHHFRRLRVQTGEHSGSRWGANRLTDIRVFEHETTLCEQVQCRGLDMWRTVALHRVRSLLVRDYKKQIRSIWQLCPLG